MDRTLQTAWTAEDQLKMLEPPMQFFVVDVRNRGEFAVFRPEGRRPLAALNTVYFELLELGGKKGEVSTLESGKNVCALSGEAG